MAVFDLPFSFGPDLTPPTLRAAKTLFPLPFPYAYPSTRNAEVFRARVSPLPP